MTPADLAQAAVASVDGTWVAAREPSIAGTADLATSADGIAWTVGTSLGLPGSAKVVALASSPSGGERPGPTTGPPSISVPTTAPGPTTSTTVTAAAGIELKVGSLPVTVQDAPTRDGNPLWNLFPGEPVIVSCQVKGDFIGEPQSDSGSSVWNRLPDGTYVPDWYIDGPKAGVQDAIAGTFVYDISPEIGAC